ncbi:MAG: GNAT family N-acetyltransferase [Fimbriimonadales bacterium]
MRSEVDIRRLEPTDDLQELTDLLHRAYKQLADMGFRFLATHQDTETTRERTQGGECFVGHIEGPIVATMTFYDAAHTSGCSWYDRPEVASFGQFAVEPSLQRSGIGSRLIELAEGRALETGATELALDTAEGATRLIGLYERRGYRLVGNADWNETNYRSVILSKRILE